MQPKKKFFQGYIWQGFAKNKQEEWLSIEMNSL